MYNKEKNSLQPFRNKSLLKCVCLKSNGASLEKLKTAKTAFIIVNCTNLTNSIINIDILPHKAIH